MEKQTGKPGGKRKRLIVVLVIVLVIFAAAVIGMIVLAMQQQRDAELNRQMQQIAQQTPEPSASPSETPEVSATPTADIPIDFEALQAQNANIYAWITIPGTDIDYPILQNPLDDAFYLTHNAAGQESVEGAIFTEMANSKDFTDPNTVIYGHRMNNGSMFAGLHQYEDKGFFDSNREVIIYTPSQKLTYKIFAAYAAGDEHILQTYDFSNPGVYTGYLDKIFEVRDMKASVDRTMQVDNQDKIITLSTCIKGQDEKRYLVQAVLETDE